MSCSFSSSSPPRAATTTTAATPGTPGPPRDRDRRRGRRRGRRPAPRPRPPPRAPPPGSLTSTGLSKVSHGRIALELDDYYFKPTFIQSAHGAEVTVTLHNEGDHTHTFTSKVLDVDEEVAPGKTAKVTITLPAEFVCRFHGDKGMKGAFYGKRGDKVAAG